MMRVPRGWKKVRLGDLAEIVRGASPRPAGDPRYFDGDYLPWITVSDVTNCPSIYLTGTKSKLTEEGARYTRIIEPDTLLLSNSGATLGVPKISRIRAGANDGVAMLLNVKGALREFLYFVLESKTLYFRNHVAPGNGQPNLNTDLLKEEPLLLPPMEEQELIAECLADWDASVRHSERLIVLKSQLLAVWARHLLRNSEWPLRRISEIFAVVRRSVHSDGIPIATISAGRGFLTQQERFNRVIAGESYANYTCLERGEFAYNKGSSKLYQFGCVYRLTNYAAVAVPSVYVSFAPAADIVPEFYEAWFEADMLWPQLRRIVNSGVRNDGLLNVTPEEFVKLQVPVPVKEEQFRISTVISEAKEEIALLRAKSRALHEQKRGLMQRLLSGDLRLSRNMVSAV